ncbi:hypothetical protein D3C76_1473260 [compost metagenome]
MTSVLRVIRSFQRQVAPSDILYLGAYRNDSPLMSRPSPVTKSLYLPSVMAPPAVRVSCSVRSFSTKTSRPLMSLLPALKM